MTNWSIQEGNLIFENVWKYVLRLSWVNNCDMFGYAFRIFQSLLYTCSKSACFYSNLLINVIMNVNWICTYYCSNADIKRNLLCKE